MLPGIGSAVGAQFTPVFIPVILNDATVTNYDLYEPATAGYMLTDIGTINHETGTGYNYVADWKQSGAGSVSGYEARATVLTPPTKGQLSADWTFGTWESLLYNRAFGLTARASQTGPAEQERISAVVFVEIRGAAAPYTVYDSANITLQASWFV